MAHRLGGERPKPVRSFGAQAGATAAAGNLPNNLGGQRCPRCHELLDDLLGAFAALGLGLDRLLHGQHRNGAMVSHADGTRDA